MSDTQNPLLGVYRPPEQCFVGGEGTELIDDSGRRYLDFTSGIGVSALGHGSTVVRQAVEASLDTGLIHASNLFRTEPARRLASALTERSGLDRAFFCNSGAESVEGALKFARKWARTRGGNEKHRVVAFRGGFHGRLFGSLAVTDRPEYREPFEPLMPGVDFVDGSDPDSVERALDPDRTAAVILEPIQGEVGVKPIARDLIRRVREWTRVREVALIFDEVQCGLGRAGTLFAHETADVRPDLLCLAKPLGGGFPMGAVVLAGHVAEVMKPGDHGTTFGGGPLISRVALAVLETIGAPAFLEEVRRKGAVLSEMLEALASENAPRISEVRGRGLFWGIELEDPAGPVVVRAREMGLLAVPAGPHVVRLLPPLTVRDDELERAVEILGEALA